MSLTDQRQEVADALTAVGVKASAFVPDRVQPPIAVVGPGTPYMEPRELKVFKPGVFTVRMEVTLIAATAANKQTTEQLDQLIETALTALCVTHDWTLESVSEPGLLQSGNAGYLATNITITNRLEVN